MAVAGNLSPPLRAPAQGADRTANDTRHSGAALDEADIPTPITIGALSSAGGALACAQEEQHSETQTRPGHDTRHTSTLTQMGIALRNPLGNKPAPIAIAGSASNGFDAVVRTDDSEETRIQVPRRSRQPPSPLPLSQPSRPVQSTEMSSAPLTSPPASHTQHGGGMLKRLATKLRSPTHAQDPNALGSSHDQSKPSRKTMLRLPSMPKASSPTTLTNSFVSPEQRQAALRACGLIPAVPQPYKDSHGYMVPLSEQEAELDRRRAVLVPEPRASRSDSGGEADDGESEAKKIREAWLARNRRDLVHAPPERGSLDRGFTFPSRDDYTVNTSVSPSRATFVEAHGAPLLTPSKAEFSEHSFESIPEELHTAANTSALLEREDAERHATAGPPPAGAEKELPAPPTSVSTARESLDPPVPRSDRPVLTPPPSTCSDMTQKVSRWMEESSMSPTAISVSSASSVAEQLPGTQASGASGASSLMSSKRKERLAPIIITTPSRPPSPSLSTKQNPTSAPAHSLPGSRSHSPDLDPGSLTPKPPTARGRSATVAQSPSTGCCAPPSLSSPSSSSGWQSRSRSTTLPALSPTRTASSSSASASVTTPTTLSHSFESHGCGRPRPSELVARPRGGEKEFDATVIIESPVEDDASSLLLEMGEMASMLRPSQIPTDKERRKSITLGIFTKKPQGNETPPFPAPRPSTSMLSLRKISSKLQFRPKHAVLTSSSTPDIGRDSATRANTSRVPPLPSSCAPSSFDSRSRTVGVGLRNRARDATLSPHRQALSPTMHNRESMLFEANRIQDAESRRLSEMAFLDC